MGTNERRERERRELRKKILDAARELFAAHGWEAVTMRAIAEKVEYTPAALYFHFADKEALLTELCSEDFLSLAGSFRSAAAEPDPVARIRRIGLAYAEFGLTHPNHYRFLFLTPHPPVPKDDAKVRPGDPNQDAWAVLRNTVAEAIAARRLRPELKDVDLVSQMLWSGVHGVVALAITRADDPWVDWRPARTVVAATIDALLRGIVREGLPAPRRAAGRARKG